MDLCNINEIEQLLARYGFHFSKSLGQNFLIDASVPYNIANSSFADFDTDVLEIGPGIGCLTQQLSLISGKVISVELDKALLPILNETLADYTNSEIIYGDIMKLDIAEISENHFSHTKHVVCANLPYNITTPVLTKLIDSGIFSTITVMIQKEVAQRICAKPGSKEFGAYSLYCQYYTDTEYLFDVSRECFTPAPKVTSAVIRMNIRNNPPVDVHNPKYMFSLIKAAFALRRKTLLNALSSGLSLSKEDIRTALQTIGLPETIRGEALSLQNYADLSNIFTSTK